MCSSSSSFPPCLSSPSHTFSPPHWTSGPTHSSSSSVRPHPRLISGLPLSIPTSLPAAETRGGSVGRRVGGSGTPFSNPPSHTDISTKTPAAVFPSDGYKKKRRRRREDEAKSSRPSLIFSFFFPSPELLARLRTYSTKQEKAEIRREEEERKKSGEIYFLVYFRDCGAFPSFWPHLFFPWRVFSPPECDTISRPPSPASFLSSTVLYRQPA